MTARNAMIVALVKIWKDAEQRDKDIVLLREAADRLDGDIKDLEEENGALKVAMAEQFVEGFQAALEQIRVLFPDIVGDRMAQVDFMKKVEDGKLVSRLP
jgi:chromosome segregation ATPase